MAQFMAAAYTYAPGLMDKSLFFEALKASVYEMKKNLVDHIPKLRKWDLPDALSIIAANSTMRTVRAPGQPTSQQAAYCVAHQTPSHPASAAFCELFFRFLCWRT